MSSYDTLVHREQGGAKLIVESGGEIEVQAGGTLSFADGEVAATYEKSFAYGDTSPLRIGSIPAGKRVLRCHVKVETTFDGAAPTLSVGDAGSVGRLQATTDNAPGTADVYSSTPMHRYAAATNVNVYITPDASTQGAGVVILEIG